MWTERSSNPKKTYSTRKQWIKFGTKHCAHPRKDYVTWMTKSAWKQGNHFLVCYRPR
ncbi:MAG: hypothetical protein QM655_04320 [Nocardioidaceae bacterium]